MSITERWLRPGRTEARDVRVDLFLLIAFGLVVIATGIGFRDPWPADEPRFALIVRDMAASGQWLVPTVGGDLYADKPPLFFWIVGAFFVATGSMRFALLLPGLLAGLGSAVLVYDLARRLWDRTTGLMAGLALLATVQFVWQARQGQIDATLCFFTTLGLYGLLRHLLLGPAWGWYVAGWTAAGFGVITKGVGFLPLLVLIPYGVAGALGWVLRGRSALNWRWGLGPLAMLAAMSVWLIPMLLASVGSPELAAYRHEILFGQTFDRYAHAWHHNEPFWYFLVQVIPFLWLPLIALVPWLWPHWRTSWIERDLRVWLPLAWVLLVLLFFSLGSGKRGVYVLPAVPAFVLACAPFLGKVASRRGPRAMLFGVAAGIALLTLGLAVWLSTSSATSPSATATSGLIGLMTTYDIDARGPLFAIAIISSLVCIAAQPRHGIAAYVGVLSSVLLILGFWVNPLINEVRSGAKFMRRVEALAPADRELGLVGYREQYLLQLTRPVVNFGHRRWREPDREAEDAAAWLAADSTRLLLVDEWALKWCFGTATVHEAGIANRLRWFLVSGKPDPTCASRGRLDAARRYAPPRTRMAQAE